MSLEPRAPRVHGSRRTTLFHNNLTPSRDYLVRSIRQGITTRKLRTNDLLLLFIHLRELALDEFAEFIEWGNSVAHMRRDRGPLWKQAVDIWAAQLYFRDLDWRNIPLARLPTHVFETLLWLIDYLSDWQVRHDFGGITRDEAKHTLFHLYSPPRKPKGPRGQDERSGFVYLVSEQTSDPRDLAFVRQLIRFCDVDALNIPPAPMSHYVQLFQRALRLLGARPWKLDAQEQIYIQLHFLICLHHTIIDIDYDVLASVVDKPATPYTAMLCASAMHKTLSLDIAFYYREPNGNLDQVDLDSGDKRYPNLTYPVIATDLAEKRYLLESDVNILACLFNHPLAVRIHKGEPRLIALDRTHCPYPVRRTRTGLREGGAIADFIDTFARH
jgi:hypothetical protein